MEQRAIFVDQVNSHTKKEEGGTAVHLAGGHELFLAANDPHLPGWTQALSLAEEEHFPIYFEFEPGSRVVQLLLLCTPRTAESLRPKPDGEVTVFFRRAPSYYTLKPFRPHFEAMLALLKKSAETHTPVSVAVEPTSLEILHVQVETSH